MASLRVASHCLIHDMTSSQEAGAHRTGPTESGRVPLCPTTSKRVRCFDRYGKLWPARAFGREPEDLDVHGNFQAGLLKTIIERGEFAGEICEFAIVEFRKDNCIQGILL